MTQTERFTGGTVPRYLAILVAAVLGLSLMPAAALADHNPNDADPCEDAPVSDFADRDEARAVHRPSIDCAVYRQITVGAGTNANGEEIYLPLREVTRGQMASFIYNTLVAGGYEEDFTSEGGTDRFSDISGNVHKRAINILADENIVNGFPDGTYKPGRSITRQQMASFIVQAARWAAGDDHAITRDAADRFTDVSNQNVHKPNIEAGADAGLFQGVTATTFRPGINVLRDQMATFLVNLLSFIFDPNRAPGEQARVNITDSSVQAGDPITGVILNAQSATVSGPCVTAGAVTDTNADEEGIQFSIPTNNNATAGSCELTFTITDEDGDEVTRTATVTIEGETPPGGGVTERPELVAADIVKTTKAGQQTPGALNQVGTVVSYTFDEPVTGAAPNFTLFYIYSWDGVQYVGDYAEVDSTNNRRVLVRFDDVTDATGAPQAADLTVATVDPGAVRDGDNTTNPEGDDAIGSSRTVTNTAGITAAPDLVNVQNARPGANTNELAIDFTFDEAAFVNIPGGFHLVLTDGTDVTCTGPAENTNSTGAPSGQTVAGGNGTQTITVICPAVNNARIQEANIARGYVDEDTVSDQQNDVGAPGTVAGNGNALQASQSPDRPSDTPDLVSATFFREATDSQTGAQVDQVLYEFDEAVLLNTTANNADAGDNPAGSAAALAARFFVYDTAGNDTAGTDAQRVGGNDRQVLVTFANNALNNAVGANVEDDAVVEATGSAGNVAAPAAQTNEEDEVGVANAAATQITPGQTDGPDLTGVTIARSTAPGGAATTTVTYAFDEDIDDASLTAGDAASFFLYTSLGQRYTCTRIIPPTAGDRSEDADNTVVCDRYQDDNGAQVTASQIADAVLGTVQDGAVDDEEAGGNTNPEGAAATTGGTGSPRQ